MSTAAATVPAAPRRSALLPPATSEAASVRRARAGVAFGPRAIGFFVIGLLWLIPAFVDERFAVALVVWNVLVFGVWAIDLSRLPRPESIVVRRSWTAASALSVTSTIDLAVDNRSTRVIAVEVVDAVPATLRAEPASAALTLAPHGSATTRYAVRPAVRGITPVGDAYLRYQSPLRFAERWARAPIAQTIVTCPNLDEAKRQSIHLIRSRQIAVEQRSTRIRGAGRAFESLREYRPGDEVRDICWTASARRGKLVTRLYEVERSQTIWLVIDSGRLMRARVSGLSKLDHAVNGALALAQVALGSGDRVGVLAYGRTIATRLPASQGSAHLKTLVESLALVREDEWEGDHLLAAGRLLADQKQRSLIVWITDLAETAMTPDVVRAASQLTARHVVLFVAIGQPDLQAVADRRPESVAEFYEGAAAQEVGERRDLLLARLREQGALALETSASGLSAALVNSYLDVKRRNRI